MEIESPQRLLNLDHYKELNKMFENKYEEAKWLEELISNLVLLIYSQVDTYIIYVSNQPMEFQKDEQPADYSLRATNY